uniref:Galectin n=1 Tax=Micrurus lemniscatus lemniscatus TaxID=129467 RepID=A0A2D4IUG7_MICLE
MTLWVWSFSSRHWITIIITIIIKCTGPRKQSQGDPTSLVATQGVKSKHLVVHHHAGGGCSLLPAPSLFESQVDDRSAGHVVVSQGVGIFDEDALVLELLFPGRHAGGLVNLHLDYRNLVGEWEGEDQHLAAQLPFRFVLHVGDLDFDSDRTLVPA